MPAKSGSYIRACASRDQPLALAIEKSALIRRQSPLSKLPTAGFANLISRDLMLPNFEH
jgi:hypothetical protein